MFFLISSYLITFEFRVYEGAMKVKLTKVQLPLVIPASTVSCYDKDQFSNNKMLLFFTPLFKLTENPYLALEEIVHENSDKAETVSL